MAEPGGRVYRFGTYTLDLDRGCLRQGSTEAKLRRKSFEVLSYFVANAGRLITKDELMAAAWPNQIVSDDSLVQCVRELRVVLADDAHERIKTVPGRGYIFDVPVTTVSPAPSPPAVGEVSALTFDNLLSWLKRLPLRRKLGAAAVIAGCVALLVWWAGSPPAPPATVSAVGAVYPLSIAVLPFSDLSGGSGHAHVIDALVEDIATGLSRVRDMFVISYRSVAAYRGQQVDVRTIGREFGVRYVVQGSIRPHGDDWRVSMQLLDAESGAQLWAAPLEYRRNDTPGTASRAVANLAFALGSKMIDAESQRSVRERPNNPEARDLVLRGRALMLKGPARAVNEDARRLFEAALERDSDSLSALLGIADTNLYSVLNQWAPQEERAARLDRAGEVLLRAIALRPDQPHARSSRGSLLRARGEPEQAVAAFEQAIRVAPNYALAHAELGRTKVDLGLAAEAIGHIERAMRLSPHDPDLFVWCFWAGQAALHIGDDEAAVKWLRQAIEMRPAFRNPVPWLAVALERLGREDEARRAFAEFRRERPDATIAQWDRAYDRHNPAVLAQRARIYESLRRLGLPE